MPDSLLDSGRHTNVSQVEPVPPWKMRCLQRDLTQVKDEHKTAVTSFKGLGDVANNGKK